MLTELSRREKAANVKPDPDIDVYMKVNIKSVGSKLSCPRQNRPLTGATEDKKRKQEDII